jgi:hypothetical protein
MFILLKEFMILLPTALLTLIGIRRMLSAIHIENVRTTGGVDFVYTASAPLSH